MSTAAVPTWTMHNARLIEILSGPHRSDVLTWIDTIHQPEDLDDPSMEVVEEIMTDLMECLAPGATTTRRLLSATDPKLAQLGDVLVDPQMAGRLIDFGINPLTLCAFALHDLPQMMVTQGALAGLTAECEITTTGGEIVMLPGLMLGQCMFDMMDDDVLASKHAVPDTVLAAMRGRRVDEVVSSPIVDGLDLRIDHGEALGDGSTRLWLIERKRMRLIDLARERGWAT